MERFLIVGLGNPGKKYENTRHNVGFMVVDEIARVYHIAVDKKQNNALVGEGTLLGKRVLLAKPQTFMNESGKAVRGLVDFYKIPLEAIIVIHDDIDIDLGVLRLRPHGRSGGHNGLKSISQHLGTQIFTRVRFGVSRPPGQMDPAAHVLRPFDSAETPLLVEMIHRARLAIEIWLTEGLESAMNKQNGTTEDVAERQRKAQTQKQTIKPTSYPEDSPRPNKE